jgi:aryl-alcohol dehydrogenase-like predicted oxidoreductase
MNAPASKSSAFSPSRYVYGTTRLGDSKFSLEERVSVARKAMSSGVWFHTSRQYGDALEVLGRAFSEDRAHVPKLIVKIGNNDLAELRSNIRENIAPMGVDHVDVGQLCLGGRYAEEFRTGGRCFDDFRRLRDEGLVRSFVVEVFPWTSRMSVDALRAGHAEGVVDAFIFYLNPMQRFASNELWDLIHEKGAAVIAMRTVCGAPVHRLRDVPGAAWLPYLQERAVEVAPIFERSGVADWAEFCVRYAFSFPLVKATVGSTVHQAHLDAFLRIAGAGAVHPLPRETVEQLQELQRRWSDQVDVRAKPWTM